MNKISIVTIFLLILLQGCSAPGSSGQEKRAAIESMGQNVLVDIYKLKPELRAEVNSAPGYAVFSNVNINIIFFSAGTGYGQALNHFLLIDKH